MAEVECICVNSIVLLKYRYNCLQCDVFQLLFILLYVFIYIHLYFILYLCLSLFILFYDRYCLLIILFILLFSNSYISFFINLYAINRTNMDLFNYIIFQKIIIGFADINYIYCPYNYMVLLHYHNYQCI